MHHQYNNQSTLWIKDACVSMVTVAKSEPVRLCRYHLYVLGKNFPLETASCVVRVKRARLWEPRSRWESKISVERFHIALRTDPPSVAWLCRLWLEFPVAAAEEDIAFTQEHPNKLQTRTTRIFDHLKGWLWTLVTL